MGSIMLGTQTLHGIDVYFCAKLLSVFESPVCSPRTTPGVLMRAISGVEYPHTIICAG